MTVGHFLSLEWGQTSAESSRLLLSQVLWQISFLLGICSSRCNPLLAQHSKDLGNRLSDLTDLGQLNLGLGGDFADSERGKLSLNTTNTLETVNERELAPQTY